MDKITEQMPVVKINIKASKIPHKLQLADLSWHTPSNIDMLLGASIFWDLIGNRRIKEPSKALLFRETLLGWIVTGANDSHRACSTKKSYCNVAMSATMDEQIKNLAN